MRYIPFNIQTAPGATARRIHLVLACAIALALAGRPSALAITEEDHEPEDPLAKKTVMPAPPVKKEISDVVKEILQKAPRPQPPAGPTFVVKIVVEGVASVPHPVIRDIIKTYRDRRLTDKDIFECAGRITAAYRERGFLTSYAVFESLTRATLTFTVHEGVIGNVTIHGNRYYSNDVISARLNMEPGDVFNARNMQQGVFKANKHMDRKLKMRVELDEDGAMPDFDFVVKDRPPTHLILEFDNYGSAFILYNRYKLYMIHDNLLGLDDNIQVKAQTAYKSAHELFDIDYFIPLNNKWKLELYMMPWKAEDYFGALAGLHKRAHKEYFLLYRSLVEQPGKDLSLYTGFVYKHIDWERPRGKVVAEDHFSGARIGFLMNYLDKYGRTVITEDLEQGIPEFLGASDRNEVHTSVPDAGGAYTKNHLTVARRQKIIPGTDFLIKSHYQVANDSLTGVNVFSIGGYYGVIDMRGYPRAQTYGDNGLSFSGGFAFAPYFLPRNLKVPFSSSTFYDAFQMFALIDWAQCSKTEPQPDAINDAELTSADVGFQLVLPAEAFQLRFEVGWPLSSLEPADGKDVHFLVGCRKTF